MDETDKTALRLRITEDGGATYKSGGGDYRTVTPHKIENGAPVALTEAEAAEHGARAADWHTEAPKREALEALQRLDKLLPRCVEDLIAATVADESALPEITRARLGAKRAARSVLAAA